MIYVQLAGGLGNQMFQYAAARSLAARHSTELVLDVSAFPFDIYDRRYALGAFRISASLQGDPARRPSLLAVPRVRAVVWRVHRRVLPYLRHRIVTHKTHAFDVDVTRAPDGVFLRGDFQSERYFSDIATTIRHEFQLVAPPNAANARMLDRIRESEAVCVHFRVGHHDGNARQTNQRMGMTPLSYYEQAIDHVAAMSSGDPVLFVFADKPDWVRANVHFRFPAHIVDINDGDAGHEDLRLMAACRHFVIPNSTLSWWGAWLAPYEAKVVVAPKVWFAGMNRDTRDLIPEGWTRL
jgi:hypothetical protein